MSDELPRASLSSLLEPGMAMCETHTGEIEGELFQSESIIVAKAIPSRVEEFRQGRAAARNALEQLQIRPGPIGVADSRAPIWPAGAVGSISHCEGYCGSVVALASEYRAVGMDASPNLALFDGALDQIALPSERSWVEANSELDLAGDALLFGIKETIFKLWSPITDLWLGFEEAEVSVDLISQAFSAKILANDRAAAHSFPLIVEGRFTYDESLILCQSSLKS